MSSAVAVFDELHDLVIKRYGPDSTEARDVNTKLVAALRSNSVRGGDTMLYAEKLWTLSQQTMDDTDPRRVTATIHMAEAHQTREDYTSAEILLIELWKTITDATRTQPSAGNQPLIFEVAMAYVNFLQRCARDTEATGMLLGLWYELEQSEFLSEIDLDHLRHLQRMLHSSGQLTVSLSALLTTWKWYTNSGSQYTDDANSVASDIADNVRAIQEQHRRLGARTASGKQQPEGQSADSVLQEIFDMGILDSEDFPAGRSVINNSDRTSAKLIRHERWDEAITVLERSLDLAWPSLRANRTTEKLPQEYQDQVLSLVDRLIYCLVNEKRLGEAFQMYVGLHEASKLTSDPRLMSRLAQPLISYYKTHGKVDSLIDIYDEILQKYRSGFGPAHADTIRTMYTLSSLCDSINRQDSMLDYNEQILVALNRDTSKCHSGAIEAALRLSEVYAEQGQWKRTADICRKLWQTVLEDYSMEGLTPNTIQTIYEGYRTALTEDAGDHYSTLRSIAEQYYEVYSRPYDPKSDVRMKAAFADVKMKAAFELAEINEREQPYQVNAVRAYQQIIATAGSSTTAEDPEMVGSMMTAQSRLAALYRRMVFNMSIYFPQVIEDAIIFFTERYNEATAKLGCSDESTLDDLAELIHLYALKDSGSDQTAASNLLQSVAAEIISNDLSPLRLMKSAAKLAEIYSNEGYIEQGTHLVDTLRRHFFLEDTLDDDGSIGVLHRSLDPKCYIFIVTLEVGLTRSEKQSFSQVMPDLLYENICYKMCVGSEDLTKKLYWGLRLHEILRNSKRFREIDSLEKILFKGLFGTLVSSAQPMKQSMWTMLTQTLDRLGQENTISVSEAVCAAGNDLSKTMIGNKEFGEAYAIACLTFDLAKSLKALEDPRTFAFSIRLSLSLANNSVFEEVASEDLRNHMLSLSSSILHEVLEVCGDFKESMGQIDLSDIKEVIGLLTQQNAFAELEVRLFSSLQPQLLTTPSV